MADEIKHLWCVQSTLATLWWSYRGERDCGRSMRCDRAATNSKRERRGKAEAKKERKREVINSGDWWSLQGRRRELMAGTPRHRRWGTPWHRALYGRDRNRRDGMPVSAGRPPEIREWPSRSFKFISFIYHLLSCLLCGQSWAEMIISCHQQNKLFSLLHRSALFSATFSLAKERPLKLEPFKFRAQTLVALSRKRLKKRLCQTQFC